MSPYVAYVLVSAVAVIQGLIAIVEVGGWMNPLVHGRLGFDEATAFKVAPIVANAGLYNAFLAAGLIWGLRSSQHGFAVAIFFLTCVAIAGIFGAATLTTTPPTSGIPMVIFLQTLPAGLALVAVWISWPRHKAN